MTNELYKKIKDFIKARALSIKIDENKNSEQITFPISNYFDYNPIIDNPKYYCISTNTFKSIILDNNILSEIATKDSTFFETGNAKDVLKGLLEYNETYQSFWGNDINKLECFLAKNAFSYVVKVDNNEINNEVLRLDLFREVKNNEKSFDFVGGLFHSFKHFSVGGVNLTTGTELSELYHTLRIVDYSLKAFFESAREVNKNGFISQVSYNEKYYLRFVFYHNQNTNTYYINTIIKKEKK